MVDERGRSAWEMLAAKYRGALIGETGSDGKFQPIMGGPPSGTPVAEDQTGLGVPSWQGW